MRWLLDTNVVSDQWKPRPNPAVIEWWLANEADCALSEITFAELYYGVHLLPFGKRRSELHHYVDFLRQDFGDLILSFGPMEAEAWGQYAAEVTADRGKTWWTARTIRDAALAATARAWGLTVVTGDTHHFPFVDVFNPFTT